VIQNQAIRGFDKQMILEQRAAAVANFTTTQRDSLRGAEKPSKQDVPTVLIVPLAERRSGWLVLPRLAVRLPATQKHVLNMSLRGNGMHRRARNGMPRDNQPDLRA
jgi:hypothetical protein